MTAIRKLSLSFMAFALALGLTPLPAFAEGEEVFSDVDDVVAAEEDSRVGLDGNKANLFAGEAIADDLSSISFVYVESPSVLADSVENIVIGFADDELVVEAAQLEVIGPDGAISSFDQDDSVEGAILFSIDASTFDLGDCEITSLRYRVAGDDMVREASFVQDDASAYAFKVVEMMEDSVDENGLATEVYTINSDGEYIETDSIESAMAAAGVDPEAGPSAEPIAEGGLVAQADNGFVIVLDPGHGGSDGGATGIGFSEKDVNLKIAQYCKAKLEQTPGVTVYMTRTSDVAVSLQDRVSFAVNHGADLVVSLHNNAGGGSGSEVIVPRNGSWYYEETYVTGTELGAAILAKLNALGLGTHNGVYSRDCTTGETYPDGTLSDYYTLIDGPRNEGILGIIVEHAFVDNASDAAFLNNDANLKRLGEADAQAIIDYYNSSSALSRLYWGVYDFDYYMSHYPEVKSNYDGNKVQALGYFKSMGMPAGHRGNVLFDVGYYKSNYADLQKAFGDDLVKYYEHFISNGMSEGRVGSADFDPVCYKANYSDLSSAFGNDWKSYYKHYIQFGMSEGRVANVRTSNAPSAPNPGVSEMYRLYNSSSGEHFYTSASAERDYLARIGWNYEGIGWYAPSTSSTPVYRLYNPNSGDHHYTTAAAERDYLARIGWNYEGIGWYSDDARGMPLYRLFNPNETIGTHHYTSAAAERDYLSRIGWNYEGVSWYGLK